MNIRQLTYAWPLLLLLTGCRGDAQRAEQEVPPVHVKIMQATTIPQPDEVVYSGTVEAENGTPLSFTTAGTVQTLRIRLGQTVHRGQLIAALDSTQSANALRATRAALRQAEDAWSRLKLLHERGSLPDIQWIEAESRLEQARSAEQMAAKNLKDCCLYAPYDGVIAEKSVDTGANVMPGQAVAKLVNTGTLQIKIAVPGKEMADIALGQTAQVSVSALGGQPFSARVAEKGVTANPLSRSYEVKLLVEERPAGLLPGMVADVRLRTDSAACCIIPPSVVQLDENNRTFVWVVEHGKARRQFIQCGAYLADGVIVTSGLADGEPVIVEGQQKVCDGTEVRL